jgi:GntR family transcriptional regulator
MTLDRNSPIPLYYQLKQVIIQKFQNGEWTPGEQLPTENEIQQEYGISRTTVRQALRELELDGLINRQPGRGTFVAQRKIREGTEPFTLSAAAVRMHGIELGWKVLSSDWEPLTDHIATLLSIPNGSQAFCLRRLRLANNEPIGITTAYVPGDFASHIDLTYADQGGSMNYLRETNLDRCEAERIVEALPAEREEAELLGIERRDPVLVITRLVRDCDSHPIEYFRGVYRGDRFQYHVESLPAQT